MEALHGLVTIEKIVTIYLVQLSRLSVRIGVA